MTLDDGFGNTRETCGEGCRMQIVRPGRIECEMCDGNPRIAKLEGQVVELKHELEVTDGLLARRQEILEAIPECEAHGFCIPHALEWIERMKAGAGVMTSMQYNTAVIVNGSVVMVTHEDFVLTYTDIVHLSGEENWDGPTVTYRRADQPKSEGTTWLGGPDVRIKDGTIFNVIHTGDA